MNDTESAPEDSAAIVGSHNVNASRMGQSVAVLDWCIGHLVKERAASDFTFRGADPADLSTLSENHQKFLLDYLERFAGGASRRARSRRMSAWSRSRT